MSREPTTPKGWGILLSKLWGPRFPVDVRTIALEYTSQRFADPIAKIAPAEVETFEGALFFRPKTDRWVVLYNPSIPTRGRINFTLGHELGHYLNHRSLDFARSPDGIQCAPDRVLGFDRDAQRRRIETEADEFASYLLMPMDDFRLQVQGQPISLELLRHCADRYDVSFTAAALKWIEFTPERAVLVVGRDEFVLWSRSSEAARRTRVWFKSGTPLPAGSLAMQPNAREVIGSSGVVLPAGVWSAREPVREMTIFADRYDLTISLLVFPKDAPSLWEQNEDEEPDHELRF